MKKINKKIQLFRRINPRLVQIPLFMIAMSILGIISAYINRDNNYSILRDIVYIYYIMLFIITPLSTVALVYKKFRHNKIRRKNILKRMFTTIIPAIYMLLSYSYAADLNLLLFGAGGVLYFFHDYLKQGKIAVILETNPAKIIDNHKIFNEILETHCSRRVILDWAKNLDTKDFLRIKLRILREGYRRYHFFPVSETSLTRQLLLPKPVN